MVPDPGFIDLNHLTHWILVTHRLLLHCMKKPSVPKVRKILDVIQSLELAGVGDLHPAIARSPLVEGGIADAVLAAQLARRQSGSVLLQHPDDLFFRESALAHVRLPRDRTLPKNEGI